MKKKLFEIIDDSHSIVKQGNANVEINSLQFDSRMVKEGDVYFAIKGFAQDGHQYIPQAIENGAIAVVVEDYNPNVIKGVQQVVVSDNTRKALAFAADRFYNSPSRDIKLVGVTGTNGKTTIATMLFQLFTDLGFKVGLISTVENKIGEDIIPSTHTTPDVISLNRLIREMVNAGCEYAFMEVSSHAVDQDRIYKVDFKGGVFTNMSHDHLDYHNTFKEYIWAKKKFFDALSSEAFALVNTDDKRGEVMLQNTAAQKLTYALKRMADYKAKILSNHVNGLFLTIDGHEAHFRMVGEFNAYNILAVYGVAREFGFSPSEILLKLSNLKGAEGRFEIVKADGVNKMGIVDYAHTPDALENVLTTIDKTKEGKIQIVTVVGCGGDRDKTKRPKMAQIASKYSDRFILTSDNPRTENPESILDDMEEGLNLSDKSRMLRIADRKQAIRAAVQLSKPGDIILVAGKGHEKYQDINGEKLPFDDKKVLAEALAASI